MLRLGQQDEGRARSEVDDVAWTKGLRSVSDPCDRWCVQLYIFFFYIYSIHAGDKLNIFYPRLYANTLHEAPRRYLAHRPGYE